MESKDVLLTSQFIRDGGQNGGVSTVMSEATIPEQCASNVGDLAEQPEGIVHPRLGHAADHDGFRCAPATQRPEPLVHPVQAHCPEIIAVFPQFRIRMPSEGDAGDPMSRLLDTPGNDDR